MISVRTKAQSANLHLIVLQPSIKLVNHVGVGGGGGAYNRWYLLAQKHSLQIYV